MRLRNFRHDSRLKALFYHMDQDRIIAVGLLTRRDLDSLGPTFSRAWPVEEAPDFHELLCAIDDADAQLRREENTEVRERAR